jgi:hypothetical protein
MRSRWLRALRTSLLVVPSGLAGCNGQDVVRLVDVRELSPDASAPDARAPDASVRDASVPELSPGAGAPDATAQTGLEPGTEGNPDELICAGVSAPVAVIAAVLPACEGPFPAKTSADCAALGLHLSLRIKQCVEECVESEQLTSTGECCVFGVNGRCCPSGEFDEELACLPDDPGTGYGSGVNPCGEGRHVTCTRSGSCRCVRN